jgi:hypothetical protein
MLAAFLHRVRQTGHFRSIRAFRGCQAPLMGTLRLRPGGHDFLIHVDDEGSDRGTPKMTARVRRRISISTSTRGVAQPMTW